MCSDLLQSLEVLSELGVDLVADQLGPVAVTDVALSVEEPLGNVVVSWLGKDVVNLLDVSLSELTGSIQRISGKWVTSWRGRSGRS